MGVVSDYIASLDEPVRGVLAAIEARVHELVPEVDEKVSYGMPTLTYRGKGLISPQQTAKHLSLFPHSSDIVPQVQDDLPGFSLSKGAIRFSVEKPIPPDVLDRVILLRREEIDAQLA